MSRRAIVTLGLSALMTLVIAGCASSSASSAPSTAASAPAEASPTAAAAACQETTDPGDVAVSIKDFEFVPAAISATVGQAIGFTNTGAAAHTVTLVDGSCTTPNINPGSADGVVFAVAGTYPFHCAIHPQMTGTITVTE